MRMTKLELKMFCEWWDSTASLNEVPGIIRDAVEEAIVRCALDSEVIRSPVGEAHYYGNGDFCVNTGELEGFHQEPVYKEIDLEEWFNG